MSNWTWILGLPLAAQLVLRFLLKTRRRASASFAPPAVASGAAPAAAAFRCVVCGKASVSIRTSVALPGDDDNDESSEQELECGSPSCGARFAGRYEESRRGSGTRFHHWGRRLTMEESLRHRALLDACPSQSSRACKCETHRALIADPGYRAGAAESFRLELSRRA